MRKLLHILIARWPVKVLGLMVILIGGLAFFVSDITLSTGNDTLIETDTLTYEDNLRYQETFGSDPVMIVFTNDSQVALLEHESLSVLNTLTNDIKDLDGVFHVSGPIGVIDYGVTQSETQYLNGLESLSSGLLQMSEMIDSLSLLPEDVDPETLQTTFQTLKTAQEELSTAADNQVTVMTDMKVVVTDEITRLEDYKATLDVNTDSDLIQSITQTVTILTNINTLYDQMITIDTNIKDGTENTAVALDGIMIQMTTLFTAMDTVEQNMSNLSTNLETMGQTLSTLAANFNMFEGSFPTSASTLEQIVYPNGTLNPMIEPFLIDDTHLYMSVTLTEDVSNDQIETLLNTIDQSLSDSMYEEALISGKPVLDFDIQSSMMESMQVMMMTAVMIMIVILLVLFPVPARLLPLVVVLLAVVATIGLMGLFTIPLTMVSMAVFPVLIGLGIDYSIQFHNRYTEEQLGGNTDE
ncbi:MAG: MMPL family transporter [Candidatus Izemoplasma sp.]|nr:MMPL family transporter [Candidatus Izemoplasma sp.]